MALQVGQYYRWLRGIRASDYYRMIIRIEEVHTIDKASYIVIEHSPEHLTCEDKFPPHYTIGYKSTLILKNESSEVSWELLDDFEYWVKECQSKQKKSRKKRTKS